MRIVVIDGQGGGIGCNIVEQLKSKPCSADIIAVGTNALATAAMLKAGADFGATGENAVFYNCRHADIITGPIGIILSDAMLGEISAGIAVAISGCSAKKILIPMTKCCVHIAGLENKPVSKYIEDAVRMIRQITERSE